MQFSFSRNALFSLECAAGIIDIRSRTHSVRRASSSRADSRQQTLKTVQSILLFNLHVESPHKKREYFIHDPLAVAYKSRDTATLTVSSSERELQKLSIFPSEHPWQCDFSLYFHPSTSSSEITQKSINSLESAKPISMFSQKVENRITRNPRMCSHNKMPSVAVNEIELARN